MFKQIRQNTTCLSVIEETSQKKEQLNLELGIKGKEKN